MFNFFADDSSLIEGLYHITGDDYNHIVNVLRMKVGEELLISDMGQSSLCVIEKIASGEVIIKVLEENYKNAELPIDITLFQALPKNDKMELIIQKAVELGVREIIPVAMKRCVVKLDDKKKLTKVARWQSIAESAAKQSKRNIIPAVSPVLSYREALEKAEKLDLVFVPYENSKGMKTTKEALKKIKKGLKVGVFIGSEGGFEISEIEQAKEKGFLTVSLGERILRTETASIVALSMLMLYSETELGENEYD